ncbi:N-acetyllactosaminide beta-1,3-N-acetylglucosaminyltransferase 2 [Saguinus oedipus]|uniref:N-acetyllactosaminide beta-1,3-N-acetylglucosaminyltransferase 2 n=1 Tax=Saguinus oedipus TaxID=9490 RepID=A0ABQ9VFT4_SAGOE|nr:N-acetyllactosaminide beta-1,3-N-acetylglucosaminyltransferase 2 [Saguinus oedipus]
MSVGRRRIKLLGILMMANVSIYLTVEVSKSSSQEKHGKGEVIIPKEKFWKISTPPEAYWNREQEKLNWQYNPILSMLANQTGEAGRFSKVSHLNYCEPDLRVTSVVTGFNNLLGRFKDFLLYLRCHNYSLLIDQPEKCARNLLVAGD